jgi:hypothetical protein
MTNGGRSTAGRGVPGARMPVVFVSHGSPMVAIETGIYQEALERFGREHRPGAMVVISAHWESGDTVRIASAAEHRLVYDFGGFPRELYELTYPAAGDPGLARRIDGMLRNGDVRSALDPTSISIRSSWCSARLASRAGSSTFTRVFSTALYRCAASLSHKNTLDKEHVYVSQVVDDLG